MRSDGDTPRTRAGAVDVGDDTPRLSPTLGAYKLLGVVGSGGMGVVYEAFDARLGRRVAIKRLHGQHHGLRILREAQALARLAHPNVVGVHEVFASDDDRLCIVMEMVDGRTLRSWIDEERPPLRARLDALLQAGRGIAAAHAAGLIHRDLKPDNIMIGDDGRVRVMDFGLARATMEPDHDPGDHTWPGAAPARTLTGAVLGTPAYMAPEQHEGRSADARSDVFSFCAALHELLHGARPFTGDTYEALQDEILAGRVHTPASSPVPAWLRAVILRGLRVDPAERWPSMEILLARLSADPTAARRRLARRFTLALVIGALAVAGTVGVTSLRRSLARARAESLAAEHLEAVQREPTDTLREAAFEAFVRDPAHAGTRALTRAWQERAHRRNGERDIAGALAAYGRAYAESRVEGDAQAAMRGIAEVYSDAWNTPALTRAVRALDPESDDPALRALRIRAALRRRDLTGAAAMITEAADPSLAATAPLLAELAHARPLAPLMGVDAVTLPGSPHDTVIVLDESRHDIVTLDPLAPPTRWHADEHIQLTPNAPWATRRGDDTVVVFDLRDPERPLGEFTASVDAQPRAALDLDGDGRDELLLRMVAPEYGLRIVDLAGGQPRVAHAATERTGSDTASVVVADLDGDGTQEIVAAVGPYRAYDLRVFHAGADGGLELVSRLPFGRVQALAALRRPDGEVMVVAAKDDSNADIDAFPEAPHLGVAPGLHLLRWTGDKLAPHALLTHPDRHASTYGYTLVAADLDGDGLDELAISFQGGPRRHTWLVRQDRDGGLHSLVLGELGVLAAAQLDDDPARELVVSDPAARQVYALGLGDAPLPPVEVADAPAAPPPPGLTDEVLIDRWERAEALATIGLPTIAAAIIRDAVIFVDEPRLRRWFEDRAAALFMDGGDFAAALELSAAGLEVPEFVDDALSRRIALFGALGRHAEAFDAARSLRERGGRYAAEAEAALARLAPLVDPHEAVEVRFDRPLAPPWRIDRPAALRRRLDAEALGVEALGDQPRLAALPIVWSGGPLHLEVELDAVHAEYHTNLAVALIDGHGEPVLGVSFGGGGHRTRDDRHHKFGCVAVGHSEMNVARRSVDSAALRHRAVLRVTYFPDRATSECVVEDGEFGGRREFAAPVRPEGGRFELVVGSLDPRHAPHWIAADIRRIVLRGAIIDVGDSSSTSDASPAARALVEGRPIEALAALSREPADRRAALELLARDDLMLPRAADAGRVLAALADVDLLHLLRARPQLVWGEREALGPRFLPLLARAWRSLARHHADDRPLQTLMLAALMGLDAVEAATPEERAALVLLFHARGMLHAELGETQRARHDLEAALARIPAEPVDLGNLPATLHLELARLLAMEDPVRASEHIDAARAADLAPELVLDRLARDPRLAHLRRDDLVADGRERPVGVIREEPDHRPLE